MSELTFSVVRRSLLLSLGAGTLAPLAARAAASAPTSKAFVRVAIPGNVFSGLEGGQPTGVLIEVVDALLKAQGLRPQYLRMPTGDALRELGQGQIDLATAVVPTGADRESRLLLSAPVITEFNVMVVRKGRTLRLESLADLHGRQVAGRIGYRYPLLERDPNIRISRYSTDAEMIRALLFGREEALVFSAISDLYAFRAEGVSSRLEVLDRAVGSVPLVVAFSPSRFKLDDVAQFDAQLAAFKQSSNWEAVLDRNGMSDLIREWPIVRS